MFYFSLSLYKLSYFAAVKDMILQKSINLPYKPYFFVCLNFVSRWMGCAVKILEEFKIITIKALKRSKETHLLGHL